MDWNKHPHQRGRSSHVGNQQARFLDSMDAPSLRHQNIDGSESVKVNGRLYVRPARDDSTTLEFSRLCWLPEGIVITPRTAANQLGWGLPPTPDGLGTVGGDFPFVVINQYAHNNTPEYLHTVYSGVTTKGVMGADVVVNLNWPLNYVNMAFIEGQPQRMFGKQQADDAGALKKGRYLPQFIARYVPILSEKRQWQWFCHRPKLREFSDTNYQDALDGTNAARAAHAPPLHQLSPPIEGWTPDVAMTSTMVISVAGLQAHSSPTFPQGWQDIEQRTWVRTGQLLAVGENRFSTTQLQDTLGKDAVIGWINSPPHYASMVTDYTYGARAQAQANGTAQLQAEVMTVGAWKPVQLDVGGGVEYRGREIVQVFSAPGSRDYRFTSWRNPVFGQISVNSPPTLLATFGTRNMVWGTNGYVSFKQTDILISKNADIDAMREQPLGAALTVIDGQSRMSGEQFSNILLRKQAADASYNAARLRNGLPADTATTDYESALSAGMASWDVRMRSLVYKEVGTKYASPSTASTTCSLVLMDGKPEDFLATRAILGQLTLPFNPCTFSSAAPFSEDGTKCLATVGELVSDTGWDGERLHFYEFVNGSVTEVATAEIDMSAVYTPATGRRELSASGRCKLAGYYSGNTLKWVEMEVDSTSWYEESPPLFRRDLFAKLIIDGGLEWVYTDTNSGGEFGENASSVSGTVKHILYFDPLYPERAVWVEFTLTAESASVTKGSAAIKWDMTSPKLVKQLYTGATLTGAAANTRPWLVPMYTNKSSGNPAGTSQLLHPQTPWTGVFVEGARKAAFSLGGGSLSNPAGTSYAFGGGRPQSSPLAPVSCSQVFGHDDNIAQASCLDGFVFGALLKSQPFGFGTTDVPIAAPIHAKVSNLDLEAITGISGLSDNILPVWSL